MLGVRKIAFKTMNLALLEGRERGLIAMRILVALMTIVKYKAGAITIILKLYTFHWIISPASVVRGS